MAAPSPLDDLKNLKKIDPSNMLDVIAHLPEAAEEALASAEKVSLKFSPFRQLVVAGMGGSAVGGLLLRDWLKPTAHVPISVHRDYGIPAHVGKDTLLFVVSYSGGTEETLSAFDEGLHRGANTVVFTSGGELLRKAEEGFLPVYRLPSGFQPRAAIAHQFFALAVAARKAGLAGEPWGEVKEAIDVLKELRDEMKPETSQWSNPAKRLAAELRDYIPFVYGGSAHEAVAYRWNTQLNENGKAPASSSFIPEAFHNATVASEGRSELMKKISAVFLLDPGEEPRLAAKTKRFEEILRPAVGKVMEIEARGEGRLARMLSALYIGDFTSTYLGILNGKDPSVVEPIDRLKRG